MRCTWQSKSLEGQSSKPWIRLAIPHFPGNLNIALDKTLDGSSPGAPGILVSLVRFSAFRTITLIRWADAWYCSRMRTFPKVTAPPTELFLRPNDSWELTLYEKMRKKIHKNVSFLLEDSTKAVDLWSEPCQYPLSAIERGNLNQIKKPSEDPSALHLKWLKANQEYKLSWLTVVRRNRFSDHPS